MSDTEAWKRKAYQLARHLDNADQLPASTWALKAVALLASLQALDPVRYAREVGGKRRRGYEPKDVHPPLPSAN